MKVLFENERQKVYMNSSDEVFVMNTKTGVTVRMQTSSEGIQIATPSNITFKNRLYHAVNGLEFKKG